MSVAAAYYGWTADNHWFVSPRPRSERRAANRYSSLEAARSDAILSRTDGSKASIIWEDGKTDTADSIAEEMKAVDG